MSRSEALAVIVGAALSAWSVPAHCQEAFDLGVKTKVDEAHRTYSVPDPKQQTHCDPAPSGEITVCGHDDSDQYRIPGNKSATGTGIPHADVGHHNPPGGVTMHSCFLQKCPKEVYLIDIDAIPKPPPGSDAEKIANGEMRAP